MTFFLRPSGDLLPSIVLCLWAAASFDPSAEGQTIEKTGNVPAIISESSGVAVSRAFPGTLWTHNDSGNSPTLFAINLNGEVLREFAVRGASVRDWEDIAIGPCPSLLVSSSKDCIYIADTGDNLERRRSVQLYILPEPDPRVASRSGIQTATRIDFRYPQGPADVESIAVDSSGMIWLVTKGRRWPIALYKLDIRGGVQPGRIRRAVLADTLGLPHVRLAGWVTGAAISPSGRQMVIRTYVDIYFLELDSEGRWILEPPACHIGAIEPQGEAIDFLDEETLVLTSESLFNRPGPIHRVSCSRSPPPPSRR